MKKLKYILASVVLATGFASCETESIDEKVKDDSLTGTPILSFDLNSKETVVTDKVEVGFTGNGVSIYARLSLVNQDNTSNPEIRYKAANLEINFSSLAVANFPTVLSIDNPSNLTSMASLQVQEYTPAEEEGKFDKVWVSYSTSFAAENQNAGYGNITHVNGTAEYMNGNFDYILFPQEPTEETQDIDLQPQRITKGNFNYLHY